MKKIVEYLLQLGITKNLPTHRIYQLRIFNWFTIFGFLAGFIRVAYMVASPIAYTTQTVLVNILPMFLCVIIGLCMYFRKVQLATVMSFMLFPVVLFLMYSATLDSAIARFLLPYFIFPFFFLKRHIYIVGSFLITTISFLLINTASIPELNFYHAGFYEYDFWLTCMDYAISIIFIFACLYSIRHMIFSYQRGLMDKKTELKKLNATKDKLFSIISHDLRSPMAATAQFLELLKDTEMSKQEFDFYLSELKTTVEDTREMMDKLLVWSKSQMNDEAPKKDNLAVREMVDNTIGSFRGHVETKAITILNEVNDSYCAVADKDMTGIILRNLIANAIKFTEIGGVISINALKTTEGKLSIRVTDNGVGIPADKQHLVLGREYYATTGTAREKGWGLGLKICQDLAIKNDAELFFESVAGKGTIFILDLPLLKVSTPVNSYEGSVGDLQFAVA